MIQQNTYALTGSLACRAGHHFPSQNISAVSGGRLASNTSHDSTPQLRGLTPVELEQRFSFQRYSEDEEFETRSASTERRALLDKRLLEDIYEQLCAQNGLETKNLRLDAHNGVVTLDGMVSDRAMKARLGHFIRRCRFVKNVVNRMRVIDASHATSLWDGSEALDDMAA